MPLLLILGPTGVGKSSVIRALGGLDAMFEYVRPLTTRPLRPGETDKEHISDADLDAAAERGDFVVVNRLYGARYATPSAPIRAAIARSHTPVIDWPITKLAVMEASFPDQCVRCYLAPPDMDSLHRRILERDGNDTRIREASDELRAFLAGEFDRQLDYQVVSHDHALLAAAQEVRDGYFACLQGRLK